jgi:hypothetical protein
MTGSGRRNASLQRQKHELGIDMIEAQLPTPKTDMRQYHEHISYVLRHYETLARFYDITTAELRFQNYQGVQRAREEMANILISGGKKYNSSKRHNTRKNRKRRKKKRMDQQQR